MIYSVNLDLGYVGDSVGYSVGDTVTLLVRF